MSVYARTVSARGFVEQLDTLLRTATMFNSSSILSTPFVLWDFYVEYLWRYQPGSWVEWTASCFRAFAIAAIAPFAVLTLLVRPA